MDEQFKHKYLYYNRFIHYAYDVYQKIRKNIYFNSVPLNRGEFNKPFFIVGCGRSGNTLLRRILTTKPGIVIPPETYVLGRVIRLHKAHKNLRWIDYVNLMLATFEYQHDFYTFEIDSLNELALKLKEVPDSKQSLAYLINQIYCFYAEKKGIKIDRWGDKTPKNAMDVYELKKVFPKAQFIHLIRNGVDVSYSYMKHDLLDAKIAALKWKNTINFLRKFGKKYPENYYEVKYEDLVSNPDGQVKQICLFLNIEYNEKMLLTKRNIDNLGDVKYLSHHKDVYNNINTQSIGKGKENFSKGQLDEVKSITDTMNTKLGYEN